MTDLVLHVGLPKTATTFLQKKVFPRMRSRLFVYRGRDDASRELVRLGHRFWRAKPAIGARHFVDSAPFRTLLERAEGRDLLVSDENITVRASGFWLEGHLTKKAFAEQARKLQRALDAQGIGLRILFVARRQDDWIASRYAESSKLSDVFSRAHFEAFLASPHLEEVSRTSLLDYAGLMRRMAQTCPDLPLLTQTFAGFEADPKAWLRELGGLLSLPPEDMEEILAFDADGRSNVSRAGADSWRLKGNGETITLEPADRDRIMGLFAASNAQFEQATGRSLGLGARGGTASRPPAPDPAPATVPAAARPAGGPARAKRAVVVVSIGQRPWIDDVAELAQAYADRVGADLHVEREAPSLDALPLPEMPDRPGRRHKRLYACKSYFAWKHLRDGYRKVLVLDDSCCINHDAPDVLSRVPRGHVGYTRTGATHAAKSFEDIARFVRANGLPEIDYDEALYMNSGVMVYDRTAMDALSPEAILRGRELLFSDFPHQSLTYWLTRSHDLPMHAINKKFNVVPAVGLDKDVRREMTDIRPHLNPKVFIYHITGMYRRRELLIPQACATIRERREAAASR